MNRSSNADLLACFASDTSFGRNMATFSPRNIFAQRDVQEDHAAFHLSLMYQSRFLPDRGSVTLWPEQYWWWCEAATAQPTRSEFVPIAIGITKAGMVIVCDVQGHRIWRIVQRSVCTVTSGGRACFTIASTKRCLLQQAYECGNTRGGGKQTQVSMRAYATMPMAACAWLRISAILTPGRNGQYTKLYNRVSSATQLLSHHSKGVGTLMDVGVLRSRRDKTMLLLTVSTSSSSWKREGRRK
jgi:hypothetical protein